MLRHILWHFPRVKIIQISKERGDSCLVGLVRSWRFVQNWRNFEGEKIRLLKSQVKRKVFSGKFSVSPVRSLLYLLVCKSYCSAFCSGWCHIARLFQRWQIVYALLLLHNTSSYSGLGWFFLPTLFAANKLRKEIYSPEWQARSAGRPRQGCAAELCGDSNGTGNGCAEQPHRLSSASSTGFKNRSGEFLLVLLLGSFFFFSFFTWSFHCFLCTRLSTSNKRH